MCYVLLVYKYKINLTRKIGFLYISKKYSDSVILNKSSYIVKIAAVSSMSHKALKYINKTVN